MFFSVTMTIGGTIIISFLLFLVPKYIVEAEIYTVGPGQQGALAACVAKLGSALFALRLHKGGRPAAEEEPAAL